MARKNKSKMKLENVGVLLLNLSLLGGPVLRRGSKRAITKAAMYLQRKLKEKLSQPGSGAIYGKHQASAPGEPPAPDTAELRNSVKYRVTGGSRGADLPDPGGSAAYARANVGTHLARGMHLEVGYNGRPYGNPRIPPRFVAARPWFYNTIEEEKGPIRALIIASLQEDLKKAKLKKSKRRR